MTQVILDIDFDFFFDSAAPLSEVVEKRFWCDPDALVISSHPQLAPVVEHHEVMMYLDAGQSRNATYYHLDAHHDMHITGSLEDLIPGSRAGFLNEGNYIAHALRDGMISRLYSICPDWQSPDQRWEELLPLLGAYTDRVMITRFSDIRETISQMAFDQVFCALSPSFTPTTSFERFAAWSRCSSELLERAQDYYRCSVVARYPGSRFKFFYTLPSVPPHDIPCVYHGSTIPSLKILQAGECGILHLSPSPAFAACFGVNPTVDEGWFHGVDHLTEAHPFVYLVVPKDKVESLNQPIYLYSVSIPDTSSLFQVGSVSGFEYGSNSAQPVKSCMSFSSAKEAFERLGVRIVDSQPLVCEDGVLLRKAKEERKNVEEFFEMPVEVIQRLDHMYPLLYAYLVSAGKISPSEFSPSYNFIWKNILERIVLPAVFPHSDNGHNGYHGMDHCHDVALAACHIALARGHAPLPALLAGALHDISRNDLPSEDHAKEAAQKIPIILAGLGKGFLACVNPSEVAAAVHEHSNDSVPTSALSAILRDADRLRLAWERGFDRTFFVTEEGMNAARLGRYYLLSSIENVLAGGITEVKTEITDQCNLSCPFCHQSFGVKKARSRMQAEDFRRVLLSARASGVRLVRITGGEPCLHPDLERFLLMAKEFGMDVILNTNGTAKPVRKYLEFAKLVDYFKISLPYSSEEASEAIGQPRSLFRIKLELLATLYAYGHTVEALTIMTPLNIDRYDEFIELLDPLKGICWVPLRAEPSTLDRRPVSRENIRQAARKVLHTRLLGGERWSELQMHLAVPFCALEDSSVSPVVFSGRRTCGPIQSLTVTPDMRVISCYSERDSLPECENLQNLAWRSPHRSLDALPDCCRSCIHSYLCMGGCVTGYALENTPFGRMDYLADPASLQSVVRDCHG